MSELLIPGSVVSKSGVYRICHSIDHGRDAEAVFLEGLVLPSCPLDGCYVHYRFERIHEQVNGTSYKSIVDTAVRVMRSDFASLQMLFPERGTGGELQLLAFRGFNPEAARFWEWVRADSKSTCGLALLTGERAIAPEIATCEFMAGSEDQQIYLQTGIHACQTTPLIGSSGRIVGMISTHWRTPHLPSERDLRVFDYLAKQAADLMEHSSPPATV